MKKILLVTLLVSLLPLPACSRRSRRLPESHPGLQAQINELCQVALEHLDRERPAMQKALSPLSQGVNLILSHKVDLDLEETDVEDLLDLRVSVEKDVNRIEARMKTLSAQIRNAIQVDGLADADLEDPLQQIGELQAEIEAAKLKGLLKAWKDLSENQRKELTEILVEEMG